jgi:hypothetical protein
VLGPLLIAAAALLACGPGAAQMPGCEISFHAVDPDGTVREQPVVGARHVLEVRQDEAEDGAGPGSRRFAVTLDDAGARALQTHTAASIGQVLAVRCDREIVSQPEIREALRSPVAVLVDELPAGHPPGLEDLDAPHEILAWVDLPRAVALGDPVSLQLTVVNGRAQGVFQLTSIDIGDGFLDGFEVLAISPTPHAREHALGVLALALPADIAPGAEWQLEIRLKPRRAGVFVGDVDIWAGGRFLTRVAQLQVR